MLVIGLWQYSRCALLVDLGYGPLWISICGSLGVYIALRVVLVEINGVTEETLSHERLLTCPMTIEDYALVLKQI
jgi:hypothetical protein